MTTAPAKAADLRVGCRYLRKRTRSTGKDDFIREPGRFDTVARGKLKLIASSGAETVIADGMESIVSYSAVDRWKPGIRPTDLVELDDGRRLNIRRLVNWEERNRWLVMVLVHRVPAIAELGND
jgi:hypothetical protein